MNRVILCGRLADRPRLAYAPCGLPVARFSLLVPRDGPDGDEDGADAIDCVALRRLAVELATWGEPNVRVNLEGRLRSRFPDESGRPCGPVVLLTGAYSADPEPADIARKLLVLPGGRPPLARLERAA